MFDCGIIARLQQEKQATSSAQGAELMICSRELSWEISVPALGYNLSCNLCVCKNSPNFFQFQLFKHGVLS
jgi:hypothetical protein